jgi:hypothetical protein
VIIAMALFQSAEHTREMFKPSVFLVPGRPHRVAARGAHSTGRIRLPGVGGSNRARGVALIGGS